MECNEIIAVAFDIAIYNLIDDSRGQFAINRHFFANSVANHFFCIKFIYFVKLNPRIELKTMLSIAWDKKQFSIDNTTWSCGFVFVL